MKQFQLILLCILLLLSTACNDWLDVSSETEPDRNDLLSTEEGFRTALTGIYAGMAHKGLYGRKLTYYIPSILSGHYGMVGNDIAHWMDYDYKGPNANADALSDIDDIWRDIYHLIANANSIIDGIESPNIALSEDAKKRIKGEAIGLRAFLHFELLRMFGEPYALSKDALSIPYATALSAEAGTRLSVEQATERIIEDLTTSMNLLQDVPFESSITFSRVTAQATMARVLQWRGEISAASDVAAQALANLPQCIRWVDSTSDAPDFSSEYIFALDVCRLKEYTAGWAYPGGVGSRSTIMALTQAAVYFFDDESDLRYRCFVSKIGYDFYCTKFAGDNTLMPLIKLAELYYIAAEGAPDVQEYLTLMNEVREHRGLEPLTAADEQRAEIADEYRREFLCEGQLWFYYKRNVLRQFPSGWNFHGNIALYTFDIPEDEILFGQQ